MQKKNNTFIHPNSSVETKKIGKNCKIWQYAVILKNAKIGDNCNICSHSFIENKVFVGKGVTIKNNVMIYDGVSIDNNCFIGPSVTFTNDIYPKAKKFRKRKNLKKTIVEEGVVIGASCTILSNLKIGKFSLIGAGSVVTKSIPSFSLAVGNPAKVIKKIKK